MHSSSLKWSRLFFGVIGLCIMGFTLLVFPLASVYAQSDGVEIAKTYVISGDAPESGDIISFDRATQTFRLANTAGDPNLFGVIVMNPMLVLKIDDGGVPAVRTGEVFVNVTTVNGVINAGDYITSSTISGKGQAAGDEDAYIVGIALESFPNDVATSSLNTESVSGGSIKVLLSVGTKEKAAESLLNKEPPQNTGITEATILNVIQYFLATFISVGAIYIAFKNFGPNIRDGIVSIGRNPLAKSSIQSMVILNSVLIILVSVGGLLVGLAILMLPI